MDYLEAQTLLDPIPPPFGKRNMFPEYVPAVVEHPDFPSASSGVVAGTHPWQPIVTTENDLLKVSFSLGTANNVVPTNWDTKFTAPTGATVKFVVLTVTTSGGKVTSCALSLDSSAPATDEISKDTPPTSHKVVLGAVGAGTSQMLVTKNILLAASVVFTETAAASADRAEPFHRWYRWDATDAAT